MSDAKKKSGPPVGAQHKPEAVKARKERRYKATMAALMGGQAGSAKARRRKER